MKRLLLIAVAALALLGGAARADSLCVSAEATYPAPGGRPVTVDTGATCVPVP